MLSSNVQVDVDISRFSRRADIVKMLKNGEIWIAMIRGQGIRWENVRPSFLSNTGFVLFCLCEAEYCRRCCEAYNGLRPLYNSEVIS